MITLQERYSAFKIARTTVLRYLPGKWVAVCDRHDWNNAYFTTHAEALSAANAHAREHHFLAADIAASQTGQEQ